MFRDWEIVVWWLAALSVLVGIGVSIHAQPARCEWCYSDICWDQSMCGPGCSCVHVGLDPNGVCVGVDDEVARDGDR